MKKSAEKVPCVSLPSESADEPPLSLSVVVWWPLSSAPCSCRLLVVRCRATVAAAHPPADHCDCAAAASALRPVRRCAVAPDRCRLLSLLSLRCAALPPPARPCASARCRAAVGRWHCQPPSVPVAVPSRCRPAVADYGQPPSASTGCSAVTAAALVTATNSSDAAGLTRTFAVLVIPAHRNH